MSHSESDSENPKPKRIVLVTGSSGFLGQHIVKQLQEDEHCDAIRLFDIVPYPSEFSGNYKPTQMVIGDITNEDDILDACKDVESVIHCAAAIDLSMYPDTDRLNAVNVQGTRNLINACLKQNVSYLVYASSANVATCEKHIFFGSEETTPIPQTKVLGPYAESKYEAEKIILDANGLMLGSGHRKLATCALRPTLLYGEGDKHFISELTRRAKEHWRSYLVKVNNLEELTQITYVGNAAHAHIMAKNSLKKNSYAAGEFYYVTDDTPLQTFFESIEPFATARGVTISTLAIPYYIAMSVVSIALLFSKIFRPFYHLKSRLPQPNFIKYVCTIFLFDRKKATMRLKYYPRFSPEESQRRSVEYYKNSK